MTRSLIGMLAASVALSACDGEEELRDRSDSEFQAEDVNSRGLAGRVFAGTETVPGAVVRIDVSPVFPSDANFAATIASSFTTSTDQTGVYRFDRAPNRYDLAVVRASDVLFYSQLGVRYLEPSVAADGPVQAWSGRVDVVTHPTLPVGHSVALFVSGPDAIGIDDAQGSAPIVRFRSFTSTVTVHAVEYVTEEGLASAVREGRSDVRIAAGGAVATTIELIPVTTRSDVALAVTAPPGFAVEGPIDVVMDLGLRTTSRPVARVAPGEKLRFGIVPGARYAARVRATSNGAVSDAGLYFFDALATTVTIPLPAPAVRQAPTTEANAEAPIGPDGVLSASGEGVHEHRLVPVSGTGTAIRVVTSEGPVRVPDVTRYGMARPTGRYTWTVERFPDMRVPDNLSGRDARVVPRSVTTSPHVVVFP